MGCWQQQGCSLATPPPPPPPRQAIGYIRENEQCSRVCVVHFVDDREAVKGITARSAVAATLQLQQPTGAGAPNSAPPCVVIGDCSGEEAAPGASSAAPAAAAAAPAATALEPIVALELLARELPPMPSEAWLLADNVALLDTVYPQFQLDCIVVRGSCFSPPAVAWLTRHLRIAPNFCFMASECSEAGGVGRSSAPRALRPPARAVPDAKFDHKLASLGGVRLITQSDSRDQRARNVARTRAVLSRIAEDILEHEIVLAPDSETPRPTPQSPRVAAAVAAAAAAVPSPARAGLAGRAPGAAGRKPSTVVAAAAPAGARESFTVDGGGGAVAQALSFAQPGGAPPASDGIAAEAAAPRVPADSEAPPFAEAAAPVETAPVPASAATDEGEEAAAIGPSSVVLLD